LALLIDHAEIEAAELARHTEQLRGSISSLQAIRSEQQIASESLLREREHDDR
jgi:hypothetical protein